MRYVAALALLGIGFTAMAQTSFRDDFSSTTLDPAWTVQAGIGTSYSLTANPGYLRYSVDGSTNNNSDNPAVWIYRPFTGTSWTLETRVSYSMPFGNGRQLYLKIPLGDLSQRFNNEIWFWREADQAGGVANNCCTYVTFFDGGTGVNVGPMNLDATDTYTVRVVRYGQNFTIWMSPDGLTWTTIASHTYTTALGSTQNVLLSGADYAGTGYADYDYVSVQGGGVFVPVDPCRVVDTRNSTGPFGGPSMAAQSTRSFPIPSGSCGIPANALAYSLNVTVVPYGPLNYLTIWPTGEMQPGVSTLNDADGRTVANAAIVSAGSGALSVFVTNATNVILDINGYFAPSQ
jgi:hypothetical protein